MDSSPESPRLMFSTICGMRPPSATMEIVDACSTACRTCGLRSRVCTHQQSSSQLLSQSRAAGQHALKTVRDV